MLRADPESPFGFPMWIGRAPLGPVSVVLGLLLLPNETPENLGFVLVPAFIFAGGALAGWRTAWLVVPAGVWFCVWLHSTRPTDCASGCEYQGPTAGVVLIASLGIACLATMGGAAATPL